MVDDTWTSRELPVLGYLVQRFEDPDALDIQAMEITKALDLSSADVARSPRKLSEATPPYLEVIPPAAEVRDPDIVFNVTERARRAVGQWPTADSVADRLVAVLQSAADREPDEEKTRRREAGSGVRLPGSVAPVATSPWRSAPRWCRVS